MCNQYTSIYFFSRIGTYILPSQNSCIHHQNRLKFNVFFFIACETLFQTYLPQWRKNFLKKLKSTAAKGIFLVDSRGDLQHAFRPKI